MLCFSFFRFMHLFFSSNLKKDDKYLVLPEVFFAPPFGCVGLATALVVKKQIDYNLLIPM